MLNIELLSQICELPGAPGFEKEIRNFLITRLQGHCDSLDIDNMGNLIALKKGRDNSQKLLLTAHMDEIGFIVQHIDEEGFIRFLPLGGFDPKTLTAQRVWIHGRKTIIGVMGTKPIHIMSPEERNKPAQIKDYFIDTGLSKAELEQIVDVGDSITRERSLIKMGECINAKSLDNRISVFMLLEAFLAQQDCSVDTYAVFTVQEELGLRGARIAANAIAPQYAINIDTTIAYDVPGATAQEMCTRLGKGIAIKIMDSSVIPDVRMIKFLKDLCAKHQIEWQSELLSAGGTDTAVVQMTGNGCIAGAISVPTRNIHQVIEMVHGKDVAHGIDLLKLIINSIDQFDRQF
ncbi:MAG TPA: M42 family metallopeptidase [Saprospiraceae bacterium]|nr:M42 family metallopeptidase [Saprospiraceae bacterium]